MDELKSLKSLITDYEINLSGQQLIDNNQSLLNFLGGLIETMSSGRYDIGRFKQLGQGNYSLVFDYDDSIAFKISSPKIIQEYDGKHLAAEDLLIQFRVMDFLNHYFNRHDDHKIIAPQQFFALQLTNTTGIAFFEKIPWQALDTYITNQNLDDDQAVELNDLVKIEIKKRLNNPIIRMMMSDVRLKRHQYLNCNNILVDDFDNLLDSTYCIIDQPGQNQFQAKVAYLIGHILNF